MSIKLSNLLIELENHLNDEQIAIECIACIEVTDSV